ncbi:uncharacterized protein V6R79_012904 [Siganus canaliculatus]
MTKLELLNVFLTDRLTAAAAEIFRAVKDTVVEYQSEIVRSKEENERLKRLLNVAVQRLLLHPEPSVQTPEDGHPSDSEWTGSMELLPKVKEEPELRHIQSDCLQQGKDSEQGNCSHVEHPEGPPAPPAGTTCSRQTVSSSPLTASQEIKAESGGEDSCGQKPTSISPSSASVYPNSKTAQSHVHSSALKSHRPLRTDQQVKGSLRSNGKQNTHILQMKNVKSLKPPPPRSHPGQSIQRWHSCKECGKGFSFACQLEVHMRWHTKEKPYSCAVCRKSFTTVSMLKRHHRIHTGEKPFRCHVCGKCFNQSAHLNTHFRLHTRERASWNRAPHS